MRVTREIIDKCQNEELKQALKKLYKLNEYYSLSDGKVRTQKNIKVFENVKHVPEQFREWMKIFDGGFLFSVSMFLTKASADVQDSYLYFEDINSDEFKKENDLPQEIVCFAMTNYGSYYFFDSEEEDGKIYEWDTEEAAAVDEWPSFSAWLESQIKEAEDDIRDGLLEPMED